jgi:hypothetical protein
VVPSPASRAACAVIYAFSRQHKVDHHNVTDSAEVMVFAAASGRSLSPTADTADPEPTPGAPRSTPTTRSGV